MSSEYLRRRISLLCGVSANSLGPSGNPHPTDLPNRAGRVREKVRHPTALLLFPMAAAPPRAEAKGEQPWWRRYLWDHLYKRTQPYSHRLKLMSRAQLARSSARFRHARTTSIIAADSAARRFTSGPFCSAWWAPSYHLSITTVSSMGLRCYGTYCPTHCLTSAYSTGTLARLRDVSSRGRPMTLTPPSRSAPSWLYILLVCSAGGLLVGSLLSWLPSPGAPRPR